MKYFVHQIKITDGNGNSLYRAKMRPARSDDIEYTDTGKLSRIYADRAAAVQHVDGLTEYNRRLCELRGEVI